jgi:cytochrome d ubiquinol oxidase subunit I
MGSARLLLPSVAAVAVATLHVGHFNGQLMEEQQPMKMAAAEALYSTTTGAPFSLFAVGGPDGGEPFFSLEIPHLLSILAAGSPGATVQGLDDLQAQYAAQYGPGSYIPMVPVAFWTFRAMIGAGMLAMLFAAAYLWRARRGRRPDGGIVRAAPLLPLLPAAANSLGWIFTEMGRQPWLVYGLMTTATGVSPSVSVAEVWVSMAVYTLLYAVLAVVEVKLFLTYVRRGAEPFVDPATPADAHEDAPLQFAY